ncbi:hypothetical protein DRJ17_05905 [Candidatus Woesearchaeota archaeon]|nr:MAG: hypothetical protein DRJ17_05905 [Candidatus Woesearchaeota archaeon]
MNELKKHKNRKLLKHGTIYQYYLLKIKEVNKMLNDCNYNKVRLLYDLSKIVGFLKRHAKEDANKEGHKLCYAMYKEIEEDLEKHIEKLRIAIEGLSKESKFN